MKVFMTALVFAGMAIGSVNAQEIGFELDKGTLNILFDDKIRDSIEYEIKIPNHCPGTSVDVKKKDKKIFFCHEGAQCSEGATVNVKVRDAKKVRASVNAGNLNLKEASNLIIDIAELSALVQAGLIESRVDVIKPVRTPNYAGMQATYSKDAGQIDLKLEVLAGMISIEQ